MIQYSELASARVEAVPPVPPCVNTVPSLRVKPTASRRDPPLKLRTEASGLVGMESRSLNPKQTTVSFHLLLSSYTFETISHELRKIIPNNWNHLSHKTFVSMKCVLWKLLTASMRTTPESRLPKRTTSTPSKVDRDRIMVTKD
jgi:hypothetical protein